RWRRVASKARANCSGMPVCHIITRNFSGSKIRCGATKARTARSRSIGRRPPGVSGRVPVALLLGGLESTKEESYRFENLCLARGLATCTFDGPGQGEMYFQAKLRPDFHRFTSAVLDWLDRKPEIDAARIGVIGRSLGGFYAVHWAAHEPRLKACVCWGVLF